MSSLENAISDGLDTPILLLCFCRCNTTYQVLQEIRKAKPKRLYVSCDGAREHVLGESIKISMLQKMIAREVDWECELITRYCEENMGCRAHNSSAIDWFFEHEEAGIILEDDCLPAKSFFPYCADLLAKYSEDERVFCISGDNFQDGIQRGCGSYYFSQIPHCWGWASWRRAWRNYRIIESDLKSLIEKIESGQCPLPVPHNINASRFFLDLIKKVFSGKLDSWANVWSFCCMVNNKLTALPNKNLITNIGFDSADSTHCFDPNSKLVIANQELEFPLSHPDKVELDKDADNYTFKNVFYIKD